MEQSTFGESQIAVPASTRASDGINQWVGTSLTFSAWVAFVALGWLIVYFFHLVRKQHQYQHQQQENNPYCRLNQRRTRNKFGSAKNYVRPKTAFAGSQKLNRTSKLGGKISPKIETKLLTLLNNDRDTAQRLLSQVMRTNPGNSEEWYWEKVIWDLERDRH